MPVAFRVYSGEDREVVPPTIINQALPPFQGNFIVPRTGVLEVLISETGEIESAVMTQSVTAAYNRLAVNAARAWRFKPATLNGIPVKYRKTVQIAVKTDQSPARP
jgi:TonB family protein